MSTRDNSSSPNLSCDTVARTASGGVRSDSSTVAKEMARCAERVCDAPEGARAPGGAAAPFLDIGCANVPHAQPRKPWTRQQWLIRRAVLDRLNYWQANGYQCLWLTLTSSRTSSADQLRKHFQTLRKRIGRQFGYEGIQYVCVDTREGHGVLHMIVAWKDPDV